MKTSKEDLILQRFDRLETKIDKLVEDIIPKIREDIVMVKTTSSTSTKIITGIGGAITLLVSVAAAHWIK